MTKAQARIRIEKLRKEIDHHRYLYHVLDKQEISDAALDSLKHELQQLEEKFSDLVTDDSPTQRVGGKPRPEFKKVRHAAAMLSLNDAFTADEAREWEVRLKKLAPPSAKLQFFCEVKMDGLAIAIEYEDGVLIRASTRGDGITGEDVTENIRTIEAVPLKLGVHGRPSAQISRAAERVLRGSVEVRGEVYMAKRNFEALNRQQEKRGEEKFANPRNASAGAVRQLDPKITASRKLSFMAYGLVGNLGTMTHEQAHELLAAVGFRAGDRNERCGSIDEMIGYHERMGTLRPKFPYWSDGVVVTLNDDALFGRLGVVGKAPRGSLAFKWPAEQATTVVEDIRVQVGRTGALTPVAHLKPVQVAGTTVSRASLHNLDQIQRLDVKVGDTVILQKAGDIIPEVVQSLPKLRTGKEKIFHMPSRCPVCGSKVVRREGEVAHYCSNPKCFAQQLERLQHFVAKNAFDIDGLGPKILELLWNADLIRDPADIFTLSADDLEPLERFAEKSAQNLVESIAAVKSVTLARFIISLGIRHVGEETALDLARNFGILEKLMAGSEEEIAAVPNVGEIVAKSVAEFFRDPDNRKLIVKLAKVGVKVKRETAIVRKTPLTGKKVVVTGTLESMSREEAKARVRAAGGDWVSSVSKNTDYVVVGENPGSKFEQAKKLEVKTITEQEFLKLLK